MKWRAADHRSTGTVHEAPRPGTSLSLGAALAGLSALWCFLGAWHVSLWKDETDSISAADRSFPQLWHLVHHIDAVHAAYYAFLHAWINLFGATPAVLRLPSAVAVGVASLAAYRVTSHLLDRRTAVVVAILFAVLPRVSWMGIEARPFAAAAAVAGWLVYVFVLACDRPSARLWGIYGVLAAAGVIINIYVALVVVANGVTLLLWTPHRRHLTAWFLASAGGAVAAAPIVLTALGQRAQLGDVALGPVHLVRSIVVNQWFLGNVATSHGGLADSWKLTEILLAVAGWTLAVLAVVGGLRGRDARRRRAVAVLLPWLVLPTLVVGGYELAVSPVYSARYFGISAAPLCILMAMAATALHRPVQRSVALLLVVALAVPVYLSQRRVDGKESDWSQVAAYVGRHRSADQGVYFSPRLPPTGPVVGSTTRLIAIGYPQSFRGLRDVTVRATPVQADNLTGRSALLSASTGRFHGLTSIWVIRRRDYPRPAALEEDAILEHAGFVLHPRLRLEQTIVVQAVRPPAG